MNLNRWLIAVVLLLALILPAACATDSNESAEDGNQVELSEPVEEMAEEEAANEDDVAEEEEVAAEMPAEGELGSVDNPIVMSFVPSGEQEDIITGGDEIARLLSEATGLVIEPNVATSYAAVIEAMGAENAHIAWLNTFNYLLAHEKFDALPMLVTSRFGTTSYAGQLLTREDTGIETIADLAGVKFCRPDPLSTSGWVIPSITMQAAGVMEADLGEIIDSGNHDGVVTAIYNGDCDAGAAYVDARDSLEETFPDVKDVVIVIQVSDDIPNDNVSFIATLPGDLAESIKAGLLAIAATEEGQEALKTTYGIEGLEDVDDTFYDDFRATLDQAGVNLEDLANE